MQGSFDLRLAAVNAGMGEIGVNNNLITAEYGSRLRLGAVITTAALEADPPKQYGVVPDFCVECGYKCIKPVRRARSPETARWIITSAWSCIPKKYRRRRPSTSSRNATATRNSNSPDE